MSKIIVTLAILSLMFFTAYAAVIGYGAVNAKPYKDFTVHRKQPCVSCPHLMEKS
jgi:hypothetical protein